MPAGSLSTADATDVFAGRTTVAELDFADVPTWSDADIIAQFAAARDDRYLTQTFPPEPNFQRRMSWLFPDDGCFARAEQVDVRVAQFGKTRPHKLFAFGPLRVYTDNAPSGVVEWWYHVVPVVKNSAGEPIVLDPAVSPCKPLPYQKWLALMVDDMAYYDDVAEGYGVALGDSWSYNPFSLSSGESPHSAESLETLQGIFLYSEWSRQTELGRDPDLVLGAKPPWRGDSCLSTELETQTTTGTPGPERR
ncbi:MAG TPA: protein-glutamine glutaminase family protein [Polyangiaceae bacterium]|nr:protein-glutamine glutaminase family protein [Polyangiaceae bacterium]